MAMLSTHPAIVTIYQAGVARDGRPYLVMEYCPKPNLQVRYRREPFSVAESLRVGIQVAAAVETAHRAGVLHRDIKPANILVTEYNRPALTDFGIASTTSAAAESEGLSIPWSPPESLRRCSPQRPALGRVRARRDRLHPARRALALRDAGSAQQRGRADPPDRDGARCPLWAGRTRRSHWSARSSARWRSPRPIAPTVLSPSRARSRRRRSNSRTRSPRSTSSTTARRKMLPTRTTTGSPASGASSASAPRPRRRPDSPVPRRRRPRAAHAAGISRRWPTPSCAAPPDEVEATLRRDRTELPAALDATVLRLPSTAVGPDAAAEAPQPETAATGPSRSRKGLWIAVGAWPLVIVAVIVAVSLPGLLGGQPQQPASPSQTAEPMDPLAGVVPEPQDVAGEVTPEESASLGPTPIHRRATATSSER